MLGNGKRRVFNMPDDEWHRLQRIAANDFLPTSRWIRLVLLECMPHAELRQSNVTSRPSLLHSSPILPAPTQTTQLTSELQSHKQGNNLQLHSTNTIRKQPILSPIEQQLQQQVYDNGKKFRQGPWYGPVEDHPDVSSGNWVNYKWVKAPAPPTADRISLQTGEIYWIDFTTSTYGSDVHQEPQHLEYDTIDPNDPEYR